VSGAGAPPPAVTVRFLGSGDAFGSGGRFQACIQVRSPAGTLLLDCGASSLVAMKRSGDDPGAVDAVLLSHLHGDHFGGLPFLVLDAQFGRRERPLTVAGPPGTEDRVRAAMEVLFPGSSTTPRRFPLTFVELSAGTPTDLGVAWVTATPVEHASGAPSYALRVECGGRMLAYSGDTQWTPALVEVARDADVFICEAYFVDKQVRYHLDYRTLAGHLGELSCRRIVLTHLAADMLARQDEVDLPCAYDGMDLSL
jgi:ribonuclease BN (tRNA processing enzyme)